MATTPTGRGNAGAVSTAGMGLVLVSAARFATSGTLAKGLLEVGWSPAAAVTARLTVGALLMVAPTLVVMRGRWGAARGSVGLVTVYGLVAVAGCQLAYFNAVRTLSVGVALLLEYLAPVLVVAWMWARHGQRPRAWTLAGLALAVAGLVLVLDLSSGARVDVIGVLWGLGAACGLASYFVLSGRESADVPPIALAGGAMVVAAIALGLAGVTGVVPMTANLNNVVLAGHELSWLVPVAGLGVFSAAVAYATGIAGTRLLGARLASMLGLSEVLFAVLIAWLLLGELPVTIQLVGGGLIIASVIAVRYGDSRAVSVDPLPAAEGRSLAIASAHRR